MNGAIKAANKNYKIIQKMVVTCKDWHKIYPYTFHTYCTTFKTFMGATLYSLVYRMEVSMYLEVENPSLRVLFNVELEELEWEKLRFKQSNMISEKRLTTICHHQLYQNRMTKAYNKKVRLRVFKERDFVLKKILPTSGED